MDTREKILTGAAAAGRIAQWRASGADVQIAAGWFDPLLAASAEALAAFKRPGARLVVALGEPPEAILGLQARAEMVAALRVVDLVVTDDSSGVLPEPERHFDDDHAALRARFMAHVVERMS